MSLDVYLELAGADSPNRTGIFVREDGMVREIAREEWDEKFPGRVPLEVPQLSASNVVYQANITHNLNTMARQADLYKYLWRPDENGIKHASELIEPLSEGVIRLRNDPERFKIYNPPNGWGSYEGLIEFVEAYLGACMMYPYAEVSVSR